MRHKRAEFSFHLNCVINPLPTQALLKKEKEMLAGVWLDAQVAYQGDEYIKPSDPTFDEYYEETFNTKQK